MGRGFLEDKVFHNNKKTTNQSTKFLISVWHQEWHFNLTPLWAAFVCNFPNLLQITLDCWFGQLHHLNITGYGLGTIMVMLWTKMIWYSYISCLLKSDGLLPHPFTSFPRGIVSLCSASSDFLLCSCHSYYGNQRALSLNTNICCLNTFWN